MSPLSRYKQNQSGDKSPHSKICRPLKRALILYTIMIPGVASRFHRELPQAILFHAFSVRTGALPDGRATAPELTRASNSIQMRNGRKQNNQEAAHAGKDADGDPLRG